MYSIKCSVGLPFDYELFLIEKYHSFITTCKYIEINFPSHEFHYMLVYESDTLIDLLIFGNSAKEARCFNALTTISEDIYIKCIKKLFELYPNIKNILIDASFNKLNLKNSVLVNKSEDFILNLPDDIEQFKSDLGSKTRKHLRQRIERLLKEFSEVKYTLKYGAEIEEKTIEKIVQFNYHRMETKGKISGLDQDNIRSLYSYSQHYGCLASLELNNEVVAGCISTIINNHIFLHVLAFDSKFADFNVGEVCAFRLIETSIEKEISNVHFLWGRSELKRRFHANPFDIFSYKVYKQKSIFFFLSTIKYKLIADLQNNKDSKLLKPLRNLKFIFNNRK